MDGGKFERENDLHYPAQVSAFRLDKYEVTVGRFRSFVAATLGGWLPPPQSGKQVHLNDGKGLSAGGGTGFETGWQQAWNTEVPTSKAAWNSADGLACSTTYNTWSLVPGATETLPINCVTWPMAYAFCIWDGGFLPSKAELNYAATGGDEQRAYPWGSTVPGSNTNLAVYGCYFGGGAGSCSGLANVAPSGSVPAGAGKWAQLDLSGGLFEWAVDSTGDASADCVDCAILTPSTDHVKLGGSFASNASWLPTSGVSGYAQLPKKYEYGLRCARAP